MGDSTMGITAVLEAVDRASLQPFRPNGDGRRRRSRLKAGAMFCALGFTCGQVSADVRDNYPTTAIYGPQGDFATTGIGIRGHFGTHLAVGDLDRDTVDDVAASENDSIRIIFGAADGSLTGKSIDLQNPPAQPFYRTATISIPGFISDVVIANFIGDRWPELVCANGSSVFVIRTDSTLAGTTVQLSTVAATRGFEIVCGDASAGYGRALCAIDWNNDGIMDLAIGTKSGVVIFNGAALRPTGFAPLSSAVLASFGTGQVDSLAAGDVDGDGRKDLVVGCPQNLPAGDSGFAYGQTFVYLNAHPDAPITINGNFGPRNCGTRVACGDANGNGLAEVLVGAPENSGLAAFMYGAANPASNPITSLVPLLTGETTGAATGIFDLDGDGYPDLIFGQPEDDRTNPPPNFKFAGNVFVNFGGVGGRILTLSSLKQFDRYGQGDISGGFFYGGAAPVLAVSADDALGPTGNSQGAVYMTQIGLSSPTGSSFYAARTVAGDGAGQAVVPSTTFAKGCTAEIDFSDNDTGDGGAGDGTGGPSLETVTAFRNVTGVTAPQNASTQMVPNYWQITTTRQGWSSARITLQYPVLAGATADQLQKTLRIWQASSKSGPWVPLIDQSVDTNRREVSGVAFSMGYFCLSVAPNPAAYEFYEDFEGATTGASPTTLGFALLGGVTTGSTHPYWAVETDAHIRTWGAGQTRFGKALGSFTSTIGANGGKYLVNFWNPAQAKNDYAISRDIPLKGGVNYVVQHDFETPTGGGAGQGSNYGLVLTAHSGSSYGLVATFPGGGTNLATGFGTISTPSFSLTGDGTIQLGFRDYSTANNSFYTAIDNAFLRKASYPTSIAPAVQLTTPLLLVAPGTTLPTTALGNVTDTDDDLSRVRFLVNGLPASVGTTVTTSGSATSGTISIAATLPSGQPEKIYGINLTVWDAYGATSYAAIPLWVTSDDYNRWAVDHFPVTAFTDPNNASWQATSISAATGQANFVGYAVGAAAATNLAQALILSTTVNNGTTYAVLRFAERHTLSGHVTVSVLSSADLVTWQPLENTWSEVQRTDLGGSYDQVTLQNSVPLGGTKHFFRLSISYTP